jgi:AP-1 complex subunit gamma-1
VGSSSKFIKKKAILTAIKLVKKAPQFLSDFMPHILATLKERNHGVLLGSFAFLENAIMLDESKVDEIINEMDEIMRIYYNVSTDVSSDYEIGGSQDPFLQVTILRFLKAVRKLTNNATFIRHFS